MLEENGQDSKYWSASNSSVDFSSALSYITPKFYEMKLQFPDLSGRRLLCGRAAVAATSCLQSLRGRLGLAPAMERAMCRICLSRRPARRFSGVSRRLLHSRFRGFVHFAVVAGTSASAPSFAGAMALVDQQRAGRRGRRTLCSTISRSVRVVRQVQQLEHHHASRPAVALSTIPSSGDNCVPGGARISLTPCTGHCALQASAMIWLQDSAGRHLQFGDELECRNRRMPPAPTLAFTPNPTTVTHRQCRRR